MRDVISPAESHMSNPELDRPQVETAASGVSRVAPADILRSRIGREEISKAAAVAIALKLRQPAPISAASNGR
jgi:hypothetical protein